jgi:exopolysaccharide biosynthesis polyprenyl glycosylphosphotransferase
MKKSEVFFGVTRLPLDGIAVGSALALSYRLREASIDLIPRLHLLEPAMSLPPFDQYLRDFVLPCVLLFVLIAACLRLYVLRTTLSAWSQIGGVIIAAGLWLVCVNAWYFLILRQLFYSRALLLGAVFFISLFVIVLRMLLLLFQRSLLSRGIGRTYVLSVGVSPPSTIARDTLEHEPAYTYLGHVNDLSNVRRLLQRDEPLDLVLQTDPNPGSEETIALLNFCRSHHVGYGFLPPVLADVPHQLAVERIGLLPIMRFQPTPLDGWGRVFKRIFDLGVSILFIILLIPFFLIVSLIILVTSGWPIFYVSTRVGQEGRRTTRLFKFRTMIKNADAVKNTLTSLNHRTDGPLFKIKDDPRVTPFGKILRRFSLDELPQLFNVLSGQLSLVGPRPHLPDEVARYEADQRRVFAVKPGLTGLAQISGRSDLKFEDEVRLDLRYIEEWSIFLDLWILWRTFFVVISRDGAD